MRSNETGGLNPTRPLVVSATVGAGLLLLAATARVAIPIPGTPVPITLQPVAVLLLGLLFGARRGAASAGAYVMVGALGLPVFAMGGAGLPWLLGPTGGYLAAFPIAALAVGALAGADRAVLRTWLAGLLGMAIILLGGMAQLMWVTAGGAGDVFALGVVPFLPGALIQAAMATVLVRLLAGR